VLSSSVANAARDQGATEEVPGLGHGATNLPDGIVWGERVQLRRKRWPGYIAARTHKEGLFQNFSRGCHLDAVTCARCQVREGACSTWE